MKLFNNLFSRRKNSESEKDKVISKLKEEIQILNSTNEEIRLAAQTSLEKSFAAAMKIYSKRFQDNLKKYLASLDALHLSHEALSENEEAMLRRSWLLAHFGIIFGDVKDMEAISNLFSAYHIRIPSVKPNISLNQNEFQLTEGSLAFIKRSIEFYQVSNCGEPEANIIILWNSLFLNVLAQIQQALDLNDSFKLVMESEYSFEKLKEIKMPVIADLVLKGPSSFDSPVCIVEYGAYPLDHYLHHKDVTKMGVMLSALLLQKFNYYNISTADLKGLEVYGILIEDFDFEFCVAKLRVNRRTRPFKFIVDFSCGSGNYRFNLFDGKLDSSDLFNAATRHVAGSSGIVSSDQPIEVDLLHEVEAQILHVPDLSSKSAIRREAMDKRTRSRSPNDTSLNVLINFLVQLVGQHRKVSSFSPRPPRTPGREEVDDTDIFEMNAVFSKVVYSGRAAASVNTPLKIQTSRSRNLVVTAKEKSIIDSRPNAYVISVKPDSHFFGYEHYRVTLKEDIVTFSEFMTQEQYDLNDPSLFFISQLDLLRDLIFATYNLHQSGYASLTYSKDSVFWGGVYKLGKFETVKLLSETTAKNFTDLERNDYVLLADFVEVTYRFVSVFLSEFVPERFEDEFENVQKMFNILRHSRNSEAEIVVSFFDLYLEIRGAIMISDPSLLSAGHVMAMHQYEKLKSNFTGLIQTEENFAELKRKYPLRVMPRQTFDYSDVSESESESSESSSESDSSTSETRQAISGLEIGSSRASSKIEEIHSSPTIFERSKPTAQSSHSKSSKKPKQ